MRNEMNPRVAMARAMVQKMAALRMEFEQAWRAKRAPRIEDFVARAPEEVRSAALAELIVLEVELRQAAGESVESQEYGRRFALNPGEVSDALGMLRRSVKSVASLEDTSPMDHHSLSDTTDGQQTPTGRERAVREAIGRFRVQKWLGGGSFGDVYLAHDPTLDRLVALKVPSPNRFSSDEELGQFFEEARTAAQLKHAGIVTVHDVFRDAEQVVVVQEYVAGQDLTQHIKSGPLPLERAAALTADLADAVAFAHRNGFVHRDLKPGNILLDEQGRPHVADFGLAVHESIQRRRRDELAGTPA